MTLTHLTDVISVAEAEKMEPQQEDYSSYQKALNILGKNKATASMTEDLVPNRVVQFDLFSVPLPGARHKLSISDEGSLETVVFVDRPEVGALQYVTFEIMKVPSATNVIISPFAAGHLKLAQGSLGETFYWCEEYPLGCVNDVTMTSDYKDLSRVCIF